MPIALRQKEATIDREDFAGDGKNCGTGGDDDGSRRRNHAATGNLLRVAYS
jgi:hypothetical protein